MSDREFGQYLRARRALVSPEAAGLRPAGYRRVPGLRRDEVAALVGVSTDYYTRLEQGRVGRPSDSVLDALVRALRLGQAERTHLYNLAASPGRRPPTRPRRAVRAELVRVVDSILTGPAVIMNEHSDVLHWNALAAAVLADFPALPPTRRNMARLLFLDPAVAARHLDWETSVRDTVGILRLSAGRDPDAPGLAELVGDLSLRSEVFRELWASHHVYEKTHGRKRFHHPAVGDFELDHETLHVPGPEHLMLIVHTPVPGSASAEAISLLASLLAPHPPSGTPTRSEPGR
ncbi:MAG TPA: helix-turn-helix transcriptional regulator [Pseudonocardia sp.]|nr:helix-turn-helix transcriptional regulator [Pseudonocardia sp.]